ncbi:hypothetical protein DFH28DRAFT_941286, partial [Melampsora americana]
MSETNWLVFQLRTSADWIQWYAAVKDQAITWGLWAYINPEVAVEYLRQPPQEPEYPTASLLGDLPNLAGDALTRYNLILRDYDRQLDRFRHYQKSIDRLKQGIRNSVSTDNKRLILSQSSLRDVINMFRLMYAPTNSSRKRQVSKNWSNLRTQPPPKTNYDSWIQKWLICYTEAREIGLSEFEDTERIIYEFLEAIAPLSPSFVTVWMNRIHEQSGVYSFGVLPEFPALINLYAESIRLAPPIHQAKFAHGTTFQGRNPDGTESASGASSGNPTNNDSGNTTNSNSRNRPSCPCHGQPNDGNHRFEDCPYVNPQARPPGWQSDKAAEDRFKEACRNWKFRTAYKRAIAKHQPTTNSTNPTAKSEEDETTRAAFGTLLTDYQPSPSSVRVGNTETAILGFGKTSFRPTDSLDGTRINLKDVAYAPGFHVNLLSAEKAANAGLFLRGKDCILEESNGKPVCRLNRKSGLYLIKWDQSTADGMAPESPINTANQVSRIPTIPNPIELDLAEDLGQLAFSSSYTPRHAVASLDLWHQRLGHVNHEVLSHLVDHSSNISIDLTALPSHVCETCKVSKAKQQISRRPI